MYGFYFCVCAKQHIIYNKLCDFSLTIANLNIWICLVKSDEQNVGYSARLRAGFLLWIQNRH